MKGPIIDTKAVECILPLHTCKASSRTGIALSLSLRKPSDSTTTRRANCLLERIACASHVVYDLVHVVQNAISRREGST